MTERQKKMFNSYTQTDKVKESKASKPKNVAKPTTLKKPQSRPAKRREPKKN